MEKINSLESLKLILEKDKKWGVYHIGKYYFTIHTNRKKEEVGLVNEYNELNAENQELLQRENLPALIHEYIHYLHETSTIVGNASLLYDLELISNFSKSLVLNNNEVYTCGFENGKENWQNFVAAKMSQDTIMGDFHHEISGRLIQIKSIKTVKQELKFSLQNQVNTRDFSVPELQFDMLINGSKKSIKIRFGKFFIYEGIAYELDRIVDMKMRQDTKIKDELKGTEYTVLRMIAKYKIPLIDTKTFLSLAILSLQYLECGSKFLSYLDTVNDDFKKGIKMDESISRIKSEVSNYLRQNKSSFFCMQDVFKKTFESRHQLFRAFDHLTVQTKDFYNKRIENPTFEIELIMDGKFKELLETANTCDYIYIFDDEEDYMRDFIGSTLDEEVSQSLKALIAFADFYRSHTIHPTEKIEKTGHKCPFYYSCSASLRQDYKDICSEKPWRIFEISAQTDRKYCWYGQGVQEMVGQNIKRD
ncbi:MAG: hypothetical protein LBV59_05890 [Sphingobacterium sp.]|jgi:hypothetical protein|uniref:hypothetical protein n=1 Tax=Sphingobacterium sp. TaxID=341027 RepID=UPI0028500856|nr:hypothetical protein [Sphingobacterium sp.]MDR3007445.1 hypothetical protein [Sphingobacterium sp.]